VSEFEQPSDRETVTAAEQGGPLGTGDPRVDELLARLDSLDDAPVGEHVPVFETVLTGLRSALAEAAEPASAPGGTPTPEPA